LIAEPFIKRAFDFTLALLGLILSSPLWLFLSLAIFLADRGPVLFLQKRVGRGGKEFRLVKFRTMKTIAKGETPHRVTDIAKDPRVTRIGKALRATALDELLVLLNILKGDMSFVGPKPLPYKVEGWERMRYDNIGQVTGYKKRSQVRPGLTGLAQVYVGKSVSLSYHQRFHYDNLYIDRMNLWLDIKLIWLSFLITFRGRWEHRERTG
jgi:lipopolysaccharide/colanic/teichoic acid biosynthesis glycosyltransferase